MTITPERRQRIIMKFGDYTHGTFLVRDVSRQDLTGLYKLLRHGRPPYYLNNEGLFSMMRRAICPATVTTEDQMVKMCTEFMETI